MSIIAYTHKAINKTKPIWLFLQRLFHLLFWKFFQWAWCGQLNTLHIKCSDWLRRIKSCTCSVEPTQALHSLTPACSHPRQQKLSQSTMRRILNKWMVWCKIECLHISYLSLWWSPSYKGESLDFRQEVSTTHICLFYKMHLIYFHGFYCQWHHD